MKVVKEKSGAGRTRKDASDAGRTLEQRLHENPVIVRDIGIPGSRIHVALPPH